MQLKWIGAKKTRVLELPVPFESRSTKEGEIHFNPEAEVPNELAEKLLADYPESFVRVEPTRHAEPLAATITEASVEASVATIEPHGAVEEKEIRKAGRPRKYQPVLG